MLTNKMAEKGNKSKLCTPGNRSIDVILLSLLHFVENISQETVFNCSVLLVLAFVWDHPEVNVCIFTGEGFSCEYTQMKAETINFGGLISRGLCSMGMV